MKKSIPGIVSGENKENLPRTFTSQESLTSSQRHVESMTALRPKAHSGDRESSLGSYCPSGGLPSYVLSVPSRISTQPFPGQFQNSMFHLPTIPETPPFSPIDYVSSLSPTASPFEFPSYSPISPRIKDESNGVKAVVDPNGWIRMSLQYDVVLDISAEGALRMWNSAQDSCMSLSACHTQMTISHPKGRVLQYGPRLEVQVEDRVSVKNAKFHPRGVSFTANNCALVYLLDEAGARSTSDIFFDLHASQICDTLFLESTRNCGDLTAVERCVGQLEAAQCWTDERRVATWSIQGLRVQQTEDGLVTVTKGQGGDRLMLRTSPGNGKVRFNSSELQVTASLGSESHIFIRLGGQRLHYNGETSVFTVRNAGHSAGFDEEGILRLF